MEHDEKQLERDIQNAIRARGLKEQMQLWEAERKQSQQSEQETDQKQEIRSLWPKVRTWVYTMSVAAALIGVVAIAVPVSMWNSACRQAYRWGHQQYAKWFAPASSVAPAAPVYTYTIDQLMAEASPSINRIEAENEQRAILGHENQILDALWKVKKGDYDVAALMLNDARQELNSSDADYRVELDDIQYLEALCYLGQDNRTKAYQLLLGIANSSSKHKAAAAQLVEKIDSQIKD